MNKATRKVGMKINNVVNQRDVTRTQIRRLDVSHIRAPFTQMRYARNAIMHSAITHVTRKRQHSTNVDSVYKKLLNYMRLPLNRFSCYANIRYPYSPPRNNEVSTEWK